MAEMTSRQRALAALNHQEPDRVPIDIGGLVLYTCWHENADARVKEHLDLTPEGVAKTEARAASGETEEHGS